MTEYEQRLQMLTRMLREAIEKHHLDNGTTAPLPDDVFVQSEISGHVMVAIPTYGNEAPHILGMRIEDDAVQIEEHHILRIVSYASMWERWHERIAKLDESLDLELRRLIKGTDIQIQDKRRVNVSGSSETVAVQYFIDVTQLNGSLRFQTARWTLQWIEDENSGRWQLNENRNLLSTQRRRSRLLAKGDGKPQLTVERSLAVKLLSARNRQEASKKLFAAAHGQVGSKIPWYSITKMEACDGRIVATIPLSQNARIRADVVTVKDVHIPETVINALAGRPAITVMDHPLLRDRTIRRASKRKTAIIVELESDDRDWNEIRKELDGEV